MCDAQTRSIGLLIRSQSRRLCAVRRAIPIAASVVMHKILLFMATEEEIDSFVCLRPRRDTLWCHENPVKMYSKAAPDEVCIGFSEKKVVSC